MSKWFKYMYEHFSMIMLYTIVILRALGTQAATSIDDETTQIQNKQLCKEIYLHSFQREVCQNYTDLIPTVAEGLVMSIDECQTQFKNRKWNCSVDRKGDRVFGSMIEKGNINHILVFWNDLIRNVSCILNVAVDDQRAIIFGGRQK